MTDMILYRADRQGLMTIDGLRSWTSSRGHADDYASGYFAGFGGPCVYSTTVLAETAVLDLRTDPGAGFDRIGLDLADYPHTYMRDVLRDLAPVFRANRYQWLAFYDRQDRPDRDFDEWLYLGAVALQVTPT